MSRTVRLCPIAHAHSGGPLDYPNAHAPLDRDASYSSTALSLSSRGRAHSQRRLYLAPSIYSISMNMSPPSQFEISLPRRGPRRLAAFTITIFGMSQCAESGDSTRHQDLLYTCAPSYDYDLSVTARVARRRVGGDLATYWQFVFAHLVFSASF